MYRLFLAVRWLASRPIGIVTMVGIWLSVMATIVTVAVMTGFLSQHEQFARGIASDIVVTPRLSRAADGTVAPGADFAAIRGALDDLLESGAIASISPRLVRPALLRVDRADATIILGDRRYAERNFVRMIGIDPAVESDPAGFRAHLQAAREEELASPEEWPCVVDDPERPFWIERKRIPTKYRDARLPVLLMGARLFRWFGLRKGELVNLVTIPESADPGAQGGIKPLSERFVVGGAVMTGNQDYDGRTVYVELSRAKQFTQSVNDASEVCVTAASGGNRDGLDGLDALKASIVSALDRAEIRAKVATWREQGKHMLDAVGNERAVVGVLLFFFIVVACFNVLSTLTILVTDKTRDIGVLAALGASRRGILAIFLGNGLLMALIAGLLAVHYGVKLTEALNPINDWFALRFGISLFPRTIFAFVGIPVVVVPAFVAATFFATVLLALLCAWVPARRASRMDPVEALRHE